MACHCFKIIGAGMKERISDFLAEKGVNVSSVDESGWSGSCLFLTEGDHPPISINYKYRYYAIKKNGEETVRAVNADQSVVISYCPFCGTKYEGKLKESTSAQEQSNDQ